MLALRLFISFISCCMLTFIFSISFLNAISSKGKDHICGDGGGLYRAREGPEAKFTGSG